MRGAARFGLSGIEEQSGPLRFVENESGLRRLASCPQNLKHRLETEDVGMHSEAGDQALRHVREDAVDLAFGNTADMYLDIRQGGTLEAVLQRKARIGEPRWVH